MQCRVRHKITHKIESTHSEMGPVRQNPIQRTVRSVHIRVCSSLCTIVAHNTAQNRPDNFPSCPPDNQHCSDDVYLRERGEGQTDRQTDGIAVARTALAMPALRRTVQTDEDWLRFIGKMTDNMELMVVAYISRIIMIYDI